MVLITRCPACGYTLRFADDQAGQSVRCFSCQAECTLPSTDAPATSTQIPDQQTGSPDSSELDHASTAGDTKPTETSLSDRWWARTATGEEYGPVTKLELENWVGQGRIDPTFQLRQGQGLWHPAVDILPELAGTSATDPTSVPVSLADDSPFAPATIADDSPFAPATIADDSPFAPATIADDSAFQSADPSNPFQPPRQEHSFDTTQILDAPSAKRLRERVRWPALFLIIISCLMILFQITVNGINLWSGNFGLNQGMAPFRMQMDSVAISIVATVIGLVISLGSSILTLIGALRMRQLKSYGLAVTACVLPMIPCINSCCCVIALPFGTWGLVVLLDPQVRDLFNQPVAFDEPTS
ncbi:MAG: hypothetical protein VX346_01765 [Planctomycetota bacterium]|nr:hypothetical protein [Planctomycetota bacterium]